MYAPQDIGKSIKEKILNSNEIQNGKSLIKSTPSKFVTKWNRPDAFLKQIKRCQWDHLSLSMPIFFSQIFSGTK